MGSSAKRKILIIRFSSFGDLFHCMPCVELLKDNHTEIHWLTRNDFSETIKTNENISQVHSLYRDRGFTGLLEIAKTLNKHNFTHIYDSHNNLRSHLLVLLIAPFWKRIFKGIKFARRSKSRLRRFLWINLKINTFEKPLKVAKTFVEPIHSWVRSSQEYKLNLPELEKPFNNYICLAPSANWPLKRWPVEHWKSLISKMPSHNFAVLGGPGDDFCEELVATAPNRVKNYSAKLSWTESMSLVANADLLIGNDTGMTHFSDYYSKPTICLMGATTFGFPSKDSSKTFCKNLSCQPCSKFGKGQCKNKEYLKCLNSITPSEVAAAASLMLS